MFFRGMLKGYVLGHFPNFFVRKIIYENKIKRDEVSFGEEWLFILLFMSFIGGSITLGIGCSYAERRWYILIGIVLIIGQFIGFISWKRHVNLKYLNNKKKVHKHLIKTPVNNKHSKHASSLLQNERALNPSTVSKDTIQYSEDSQDYSYSYTIDQNDSSIKELFCKNCGKQIPTDSIYCQFCGIDLINSSIIQQNAAQPTIYTSHREKNEPTHTTAKKGLVLAARLSLVFFFLFVVVASFKMIPWYGPGRIVVYSTLIIIVSALIVILIRPSKKPRSSFFHIACILLALIITVSMSTLHFLYFAKKDDYLAHSKPEGTVYVRLEEIKPSRYSSDYRLKLNNYPLHKGSIIPVTMNQEITIQIHDPNTLHNRNWFLGFDDVETKVNITPTSINNRQIYTAYPTITLHNGNSFLLFIRFERYADFWETILY